MRTIKQELEIVIKKTPFLEEGISLGIVNLSALARKIRPELAKKMYRRNISIPSLVMALKRMKVQTKSKKSHVSLLKLARNITVRDNLKEITIRNSENTGKVQKEILNTIENKGDAFLNITTGVGETTFIYNDKTAVVMERLLAGEKVIKKIGNLSAISIDLPEVTIVTPGIYYLILKSLAWENRSE